MTAFKNDPDIDVKGKTETETDVESPVDIPQLTKTTERKLMSKVDLHVLPFLCVLYLMAFLDRVNISNAVLFGLQKDLDIQTGTKYNTALTIFFVPYIIFEIPSNILLKKLKPHVWLSFCMGMFGIIMIMQGLVQNWGGLMATRFLLGLFETGMFPGCFYLMSCWYTRGEAQKRFSFFFGSATLAGAFGGVLAFGIGKMDGLQGYRGWRWLFIIEGLLTVIIAVIWFWTLPDFPETVSWLSEDERAFIKAKLEKDTGKSAHAQSVTWRDALRVFKDYKIFVGGLAYFGLIVPAYGYAYFANSIIKSYGYSALTTQLYSVPPWAAAFGFSQLVAYFSDRLRHRYLFTIIPVCITLVGLIMLLNIHNHKHVQYGALFLVTSGTYSAMPVIVCWYAMNLGGHTRRSVGTAWQVGFGNIGGIIATYSFLSKDAPEYRNGFIICISFACLSMAACTVYLVGVWHANRQRARILAESSGHLAEDGDKTEDLGDLAPTYRYIY
ncbi:High-affinity nicotinic acid transporter [Talaromyces marneffei ATCC 18224]|uniref:MFS transporter, putative n=1 Tax=Talaromyces marneffei (strain ATCC 18224 / CBS 334.59 / QM 7333) TaxID=441960 RepID=B6QG91_TALMQ|nr:MFS transporter, putative [Talaromyces marneffei ATCC 18224]